MTIGFLIAVTIGIYLIYVLRKIALILDDVKRILNVSEISLTETISLLPAVLENVNQIAASVKETASQANDVIDDVKVEWETLIIYAKAVVEIVRAIFFKGK
ncbi:hypothetical protein [Pelosinus propionicus]|nr:hypothetical protein [Pelosinus propionicus]